MPQNQGDLWWNSNVRGLLGLRLYRALLRVSPGGTQCLVTGSQWCHGWYVSQEDVKCMGNFPLWYCRWAFHSPHIVKNPYGNRLIEVIQFSLTWTQRKRKEAILVENELFVGHHSASLLSKLFICINYTLYFFQFEIKVFCQISIIVNSYVFIIG